MRVEAIVLAGGTSSRFGADKLAAQLDGRPLLHHALGAAAAAAERLVLVLAPGAPVPSLPLDLAGRIVVARDAEPGIGPLGGLVAGLDAAAAADIALVVGGDMPAVVPDVLRLLARSLGDAPDLDAVTLQAELLSPLPMAVRPRTMAPRARALMATDRRSLRRLLESVSVVAVPATTWRALDPAGRTLFDVDVPADLQPD